MHSLFRTNIFQPLLILLLSCVGILHGTSIAEKSTYPNFCLLAANNDLIFANFKNHPTYRQILEHVTYELGLQYLKIIRDEYPDLINSFDRCRENDSIGNPPTYDYGNAGLFSPTTLRYIKVAGDLKRQFGDLSQLHIVEIGGAYGGLCKILSELGGFGSYTIIDLPQSNALAKKYLKLQGVENVFFIDSDRLSEVRDYDLVISNYAFSEIDKLEQSHYINKVISKTPNGYMTLNFISHIFALQSMSLEELIKILYNSGFQSKVIKERPITNPSNLLITWTATSSQKNLNSSWEPQLLTPSKKFQEDNAVGYSLSGGRLGDNLLAYLHAKWISYKYDLPLVRTPFYLSSQFCLEGRDQLLNKSITFKNVVQVSHEKQITADPSSTLFIIPYFTESEFEYELCNGFSAPLFEVEWNDSTFKAEVAKCIAPTNPIDTLVLPNDCLTVGVHVRRGGGVDPLPMVSRLLPLKFPPDSYYIQQIERLANIFNDQKLYVYILTDDRNPKKIVDSYAQVLNNPRIQFDYRKTNNSPHANILEDFFSFPKFDCLIICHSNFSLIASKLGSYDLLITPVHAILSGKTFIIDEVEIYCGKK